MSGEAEAVDLPALGLPAYERSLLTSCHHSIIVYGIADFLASDRYVPAAMRLIARGFLTRSEHQTSPPLGMVVRLTPDNRAALKAAAAAKATA